MQSVRVEAELIKIKYYLVLLDSKFVNLWEEVGKEDIFGIFRVFVWNELFYVIFCYFIIIILVDAVKDELEDALVVHETECSDS